MTTINVTASNPRPSACLPRPGALDLDVEVELVPEVDPDETCREHGVPYVDCCVDHTHGRTVIGEVTMVESDGGYVAYGGQPDHWVSGALLQELRRLGDADFREALRDLDRAARAAAEMAQERAEQDDKDTTGLYVLSCASGTLWLVEAASPSDAIAAWDSGDRAFRAHAADADQARWLASDKCGQSDVSPDRVETLLDRRR